MLIRGSAPLCPASEIRLGADHARLGVGSTPTSYPRAIDQSAQGLAATGIRARAGRYRVRVLRRTVTEETCLATRRPDIAAEWHAERSGSVRPDQVTWRTNRKFWWQCAKSKWHLFEAQVAQRTRGSEHGPRRITGG